MYNKQLDRSIMIYIRRARLYLDALLGALMWGIYNQGFGRRSRRGCMQTVVSEEGEFVSRFGDQEHC